MKLPQILAETDVGIPPASSGFGDAAAAPLLAAAQGIERVGRAVTTAAVTIADRRQQVAREKERVLAQQETRAAEAAIDSGIALFNEDLKLTSRDPETYEKDLLSESTRLFEQHAQGLKTATGKTTLQARRQEILDKAQLLGRRHAIDLYKDRSTGLLDQTTADLIVRAGLTPVDDEQAFNDLARRGQEAIASAGPVLGAKEVGTRQRAFAQALEAERARRHRDLDPGGFVAQADARYPNMDPQKRDVFKEHARKEIDRAEDRRLKQQEKHEKDFAEKAERDRGQMIVELEQAASRGEATLADLDTRIAMRQVKDEEGRRIRKMILEGPDERPSHRETLDRFATDVHSLRPRTTEADLNRARDDDLLNRKDFIALKDRLRTTANTLREQGESQLVRDHNQAEQLLRAYAGLPPGLIAMALKDDPGARAYAAFLPQLTQRSRLFRGKEEPLAVVETMRAQVEAMVAGGKKAKAAEVQDKIRFATPADVQGAWQRGEISKAERDAQMRHFLELRKLQPEPSAEPKGQGPRLRQVVPGG